MTRDFIYWMLYIAPLVSWIVYALFEGYREAYYWHERVTSPNKTDKDLHRIFALQRGTVILLICYGLLWPIGPWAILSFIGLSCVFSFFHNGMQYLTRNKLNPYIYKKRWWDQSTTSTAKLTKFMTPFNRTWLMFLGILIWAASFSGVIF